MMILDDLILAFLLSRLFKKSTSSPTQPTPGQPSTSSPTQPGQPSTVPPFPSAVTPPPDAQRKPEPGFVKAVEVWQVDPNIVKQATPTVKGLGVGAEAVTIQILEQSFPKGWVGKTSATPAEAATAKEVLAQWKEGGVLFMGPATLADRRAYRMTKHPANGATSQPQPAPAPPPPPPEPAPAPTSRSSVTIPEVTITPGDTPVAPFITTVRKGEGLANVAKRLSMPATAAYATQLQKANIPGPDGWYTATPLAKGGLAKKGRAGGLQPGDRLFVPMNWAVDPAAL